MDIPCKYVLEFILSFPGLEDLAVKAGLGEEGEGGEGDQIKLQVSSVPPPLTGALDLTAVTSLKLTVDRILRLPNGISFSTVRLWYNRKVPRRDLIATGALIAKCSTTLEDLSIGFHGELVLHLYALLHFPDSFLSPGPSTFGEVVENELFLDLSKATRLECLTFCSLSMDMEWITRSLHTLRENAKNIRIRIFYNISQIPGSPLNSAATCQFFLEEWARLDRLITQLWELSKIPTQVMCCDAWERDHAMGV
jgi:hypothetical protein